MAYSIVFSALRVSNLTNLSGHFGLRSKSLPIQLVQLDKIG